MSPYEWPTSLLPEFASMFCGEELGNGMSRQVYVLRTDPTKVVKVETAAKTFQNVMEWETWQNLQGSEFAKFIAPCHEISPCGSVLIMTRVEPLPSKLPANARIPTFLTDCKRENYGLLKGRVVCCDYGTNLLLNHGAFAGKPKMKKPDWY